LGAPYSEAVVYPETCNFSVIVPALFACFWRIVLLTPRGVFLFAAFACLVLAISFPLSRAKSESTTPSGGVRLRVLTLNMYGLRYPPRLGWMEDQSDCAERFRTVGTQIRKAAPPYDIVAIQELYRVPDLHVITCDPTPFLSALEREGGRFGGPGRILFTPKGRTWILEADGGIGVVTPHSIVEAQELRFVGSGGSFLAARGILYARITLPNSPVGVDTYVVHLSPGRQIAQQRKRELEILSKLIATKSSASGNPVVLLGDFNIAGPPKVGGEYGTIRRILGEPRDLWIEDSGTDEGYTYDCFSNALAALRGCDYQARIDYIWIVTNRGLSNTDYEVGISDVRRVAWHTDRPESLPVSDHYGVEAFLWLKAKTN
jgi:endonuclease/exonuclease/phosphatase family metal-dependent hydrolase